MRLRDLGGALAAAALSVAAGALFGYGYGASSNQAFWLPAVYERLAPGLYAGDPAVAAALRGPTLFYDLLAALAARAGAEEAALLLWALPAAAVGALSWSAARALGGGAGAAALAAVLVALSGALRLASPWAGDPLVKPFADHTTAAWPFVLGAVLLRLRGRRRSSWAVLAAAGFLNPLAALLGAAWLFAKEEAAGALAAAGAGAALLWLMGRGADPDLALLRAATPNTYSPWGWPWEHWLHAASWTALWAAAAAAHPERARLAPLARSALLIGAAGLAAPLLGRAAALQPLRIDAPFGWLGAVAAAGALAPRLADARPAVWMGALCAAVGLASPAPGAFLPLLGAALLAASGPLSRRAAASAAGLYGLVCPLLSPGWAGAPASAAVAAAALGLAAAAAPEEPEAWPGWARPLAGAAVALWLALPLAASLRIPDWREAPSPAERAARATPAGTRFAAPPSESGFRLRARRPVCAEWTDFNLALFDRAAAGAWRERMAVLGADWERLPEERAAALREWDRALLRRRRSPAAGGVPGWGGAAQAAEAARACGADYAVVGDALVPTGPGRS